MTVTHTTGSWMEYDFVVHRNVPVPMRDGVRLAADVYLPARGGQAVEGRFPVVMERTPYDKTNRYGEGRYFARRGSNSLNHQTAGPGTCGWGQNIFRY